MGRYMSLPPEFCARAWLMVVPGGGDSPCYYWGNAMLEKLRTYNGEKKSRPRLEAEKQRVAISFSAITSLYSTRLPEGSPRILSLQCQIPRRLRQR